MALLKPYNMLNSWNLMMMLGFENRHPGLSTRQNSPKMEHIYLARKKLEVRLYVLPRTRK